MPPTRRAITSATPSRSTCAAPLFGRACGPRAVQATVSQGKHSRRARWLVAGIAFAGSLAYIHTTTTGQHTHTHTRADAQHSGSASRRGRAQTTRQHAMPSGRRTVSSAKGSALPLPSYTTHSNPWQPETENVHTVLGSCDVLASPDELLPPAPPDPGPLPGHTSPSRRQPGETVAHQWLGASTKCSNSRINGPGCKNGCKTLST